jgi:hypothetical protein
VLRRSAALALGAAALDDVLRVDSMADQLVRTNTGVDAFPNRGLEATLQNFRTIHAIATGEGGDVLFSTFQFYDGSQVNAQRLNRAWREFFAAQQYWYVDQDALIPDRDRSINLDDCHFTRKGDELMARNFYDAIVASGRLENPRAER